LSALDVQLGQRIKAGQIVGRLGSTGRSTGPHLHYETRVKGEAVDPHKFLRAETKLAGII
jgi:murein DD-endopeptidase MepM/ murein hydrolase activator NlpD